MLKAGRAATALEALFLLPAVAAYAALARIHPDLAPQVLPYAAFCLGFILLPSYALGRLLLPASRGIMERACLGYPISQGLMFLLAWASTRLGLPWQMVYALPALGLYALWDLLRGPEEARRSEPFDIGLASAAAALSLGLCLLFFLRSRLPQPGAPAGFYYDDSIMAMGVFSTLKAMGSGLPLMDARFGDVGWTYHILLFVNNAVAQLVTGAHPLFLQKFLYPVLHWCLLAGGVVCGCRRLAGFGRTQTVLAVLLLFYSSGTDFGAIPWLQMFTNFHTFFVSLPAAVLLGLLLYGTLAGERTPMPALYAGLLFFTAGAAKSIMLLMVPLGLLPVLAWRLATRRFGADDLRFAAGVLLSGLTLRFIEYSSGEQLLFKKFNLLNSAVELANNAVDALPFALGILALSQLDPVARRRVRKAAEFALLPAAMYLLALGLTRTIEFVGGDQYFFWYSRMMLLILCAGVLGWALANRPGIARWGVALLTAGSIALFANGLASIVPPADASTPPGATLDRGEWDGLMWACANLDRTRRIISNHTSFLEDRGGNLTYAHYYDPLAVSGMYGYGWNFQWLPPAKAALIRERLKLIRAFWAAQSPAERQELLGRMQADYIFHSKREGAADFSGLTGVTRIYSNPSLDIYDMRGAALQSEGGAHGRTE